MGNRVTYLLWKDNRTYMFFQGTLGGVCAQAVSGVKLKPMVNVGIYTCSKSRWNNLSSLGRCITWLATILYGKKKLDSCQLSHLVFFNSPFSIFLI